MTENELIDACILNNRFAQRTLYDSYKRAMYTLAYRLTGDFDDANDVLQDAFLDVFKNLGSFRKDATLGAWIKTIVARKAYQRFKKPKFLELKEDFEENELISWDEQMNSEYLEKAILALPEGFRTVFVMIEIEGFTHREVGELLGISEGTSKSQLFHAKKRLREMLK
ncbi:RNA polymerase sigma factor [Lacihabitans sp. LS3-19]|uniref:RNA polymerase sigma factor n=1 Tax=Lacihabitans sp. LS3-19 TaxID=2487335 RepID=UPI0020CBA6DA|nr:RNA polymerase sigma factor [Lacihabitans sp. LS3-19]MCP9770196.1 RNA polymerase sigma factor [Lacihabitans sp. LS3-19]